MKPARDKIKRILWNVFGSLLFIVWPVLGVMKTFAMRRNKEPSAVAYLVTTVLGAVGFAAMVASNFYAHPTNLVITFFGGVLYIPSGITFWNMLTSEIRARKLSLP